jgi:hypothetical protein
MISKRLTRLEAVLVRPPDAAPVDMHSVHARLEFLLAGAGHKGANATGRFASACGVSVGRLWALATAHDRRKFARAYGALERLGRPDVTADDVAIEVIHEFVADELRHRLRPIGVPIKEPLCRVRPLEGV